MFSKCPPGLGEARFATLAVCFGSVQLTLLVAGFRVGLGEQAGKCGVIQPGVGLAPSGQLLFQRVLLLSELFETLDFVLRLLGELCLLALGGMTAFYGLVALLVGTLLASF